MHSSDRAKTTAAPPSVDLMALLSRCLGNMQMVERVLSMFSQTGRADLDRLRSAVETLDFGAIEEVTHRLKGAASNVSAARLRELLIRGEQLGRQQNVAELTPLLDELESEWTEFERYARAFRPPAGGQSHGPARFIKQPLETSYAGASC